MNHLRARRLLATLPDRTLPPETDAQVRAHAAGCTRCQRLLAQYEAMDRLLQSMPAELVPPEASAEAEGALGLLARWAGPVRSPWFERFPLHPIGAVATAVLLFVGVFLLTPPFETKTAEPFNVVVVASAHSSLPGRAERLRRGGPATQPVIREHSSDNYLLPVAVR
jgi:hypothetical protein